MVVALAVGHKTDEPNIIINANTFGPILIFAVNDTINSSEWTR